MATHSYMADVVAWSREQAALLRAGRFDELDIEHLAEEIEDVGKSEQRELNSRFVVLLAHLLKWQYQSGFRGASWEATIKGQRRSIELHVRKVPSLKAKLNDPEWWEDVWTDALVLAYKETGLSWLPEVCPWTVEEVRNPDFWPKD